MSVNPYDIKTVVLAKHAQHVVLIHFPLALFPAAVAFDFWLVLWIHWRVRRHPAESQTPTSFHAKALTIRS